MTPLLPLLDRRSAMRVLAGAGTSGLLSCSSTAPSAADSTAGLAIVSDGRTDASVALQAAIDRIARAGGGELVLARGGVTLARIAPVIAENVTLNLNGGLLLLNLSETNATGVRLRTGATLKNGTITVRSSGHPSLQSAAHAPVVVGPLYGEGGTPQDPSLNEGVRGWTIRDLVLSSDKNADDGTGNRFGAVAIQIFGGAHDGLIENIEVPDSEYMAGGVHLDWGFVGPVSSNNVPEDLAHFRAGRAFTTHPHDIAISNVRIGRLSRIPRLGSDGSFGVRLSGVYNVSVSDISIDSVTGAAFFHTAGDLGFEFAAESVKPQACRGIRFNRGSVRDAGSACLIWSNSYADNVDRATVLGYRPILNPIHSTDIVFERIQGLGDGTRRSNFGIRVDHQHGGRIVDCTARGYRRGFYIDEQVDGLDLIRPVALDNAECGISVEHPSRPPRNILIEGPVARGNGRDPQDILPVGILIGRSENVRLEGGDSPIDVVQRQAVRIAAEAVNPRATGIAGAPMIR